MTGKRRVVAEPHTRAAASVLRTMRLRYTCPCGTKIVRGDKAIWNADTREMLCPDCVVERDDLTDVAPPPHAAIPVAGADPVGVDSGPASAPDARAVSVDGITMLVAAERVHCACGAAIPAGDTVGRHDPTGTWLCQQCCELWALPPSTADALPTAPINPGIPGQSAQREYERRLARYRTGVRSAHPVLGRLMLRFGDEPSHITSLQAGVSGDRRLARKLAELGEQAFTLYDRRAPGTSDAVDHLVIGPAGVYVIDAKLHADAAIDVRRADSRNGLAADQLRVSGRDGTPLIDAMSWQTGAVRAALDTKPELVDVPVIPVLCFVEGTFPKWVPAEGNVDIAGVLVRGLYGTTHLVVRDGRFDLPARRRLVQHLAHELPGH